MQHCDGPWDARETGWFAGGSGPLAIRLQHYAGLDEQDLLDIEDLVNEQILKNEEVVTTVMDLDRR